MPTFGRVDGAWREGDLRQRANGAWTDERDNVFARVSGAWLQVQPEPQDLLPPENLAAAPTSNAVTITWSDPTQAVTPTHVQFRIPEITPVWTEYLYGINTAALSALAPTTAYQAQLRYIVRSEDDGQIELTGAPATAFFTTLALAGPGTPAADPMGSGPDATIPWGPTAGTPGAVGSAFCWWEYVIQQFNPATYEWTDSATTGDFAGTLTSIELDFVALGFDCGETLRFKYREVCDSVPDSYEFGLAFTVVCSYTDPCGGIAQTTVFSTGPWLDSIFAMPKICYENFRTNIEDFVVPDVLYGRLSGMLTPLFLSGAWNLVSRGTLDVRGEPLVAGRVPLLVPLGSSVPALTSDASFAIKVRMSVQPNSGGVNPLTIASFGDTVRFVVYTQGAGFRVSVFFPKQGGGQFSLISSIELPLNELHSLAVTIDQDGHKILYVNGAVADSDTDVTRANFAAVTANVKLFANSNMRTADVGGWDRVLSPTEVEALALSNYDAAVFELNPDIVFLFTPATFGPQLPEPTYQEAVDALNPDIEFNFDTINP